MIHVSTPSHMTLVTYKKEKCTWKRRMTKDGKNFARVIVTKAGFVLQKGVLNSEDVEEEAEEEEGQPPVKTKISPRTLIIAEVGALGLTVTHGSSVV